jgi:hypothetical protein
VNLAAVARRPRPPERIVGECKSPPRAPFHPSFQKQLSYMPLPCPCWRDEERLAPVEQEERRGAAAAVCAHACGSLDAECATS